VARYASQAAEALADYGLKCLVVACNTAAASSLPTIRARLDGVPVVGVIEPGAQAACEASRSGHIAVIGTEGTVNGRAYEEAILRRRSTARISAIATQLFVALAEEGVCSGPIALAVTRHYLAPLCASGADAPDTLVLGCTHFPMLASAIHEAIGDEIRVVDSAATTARAVRERIDAAGLRRCAAPAAVRFLATDGVARFARVGSRFLGRWISPADVELIDL
jgi:glutamate racemase